MTDEAKARKNEYTKRYHKEKITTFCIAFNRESESDIIEYLSTIENKSGYIKKLIAADRAEKSRKRVNKSCLNCGQKYCTSKRVRDKFCNYWIKEEGETE